MLISTTRFRCDACGAISESINDWTLIETHSTDGSRDGTTVAHLCPACRSRLPDLLAWLERSGETCARARSHGSSH